MISRRQALQSAYGGLGLLALTDLLRATEPSVQTTDAMQVAHLPRKAKRCIFLFMQGGVSQMDSFEYKPELNRLHGQPIPGSHAVRGELQGRLSHPHSCVASAFKFSRYGQSERYVSELFPHLAEHVDELAFIHGIETDNPNHGPSTLHVTTGSQFPGSASVGSWVNFGLGTENRDMPGFVVIQDPRGAPVNGAQTWGNGYLPAAFQGTLLRSQGKPILNLTPPHEVDAARQRGELDQLKWLNTRHLQGHAQQGELEARIRAYELAFRMQARAPELVDLSDEPDHVHEMYGLHQTETAGFGRQCLLARRMAESGVRYTMLVHGVQISPSSWDDHGDVAGGMRRHSREVDLPIAALLADLKQRGMLDETLVVWASEMGRTPFVAGNLGDKPGRDHNKYGLVMWLAGGNVRGGATAGGTDDFGLRAAEDPIPIRNVHATILNLMGLDDDRLRFLHNGRWRQLTDIGGVVLDGLLDV